MQRGAAQTQSYLTSSIPGEDRRAPTNTIDETVWDTLSRDIFAIWEKMKQVLYPKYLLGGIMQRGGGIGAAERGEADGFGGGLRNIAGRWPDADVILQGGMSEGLRDWDLWGPLIFCLLLSLFLSWGAKCDHKDLFFSGVFSTRGLHCSLNHRKPTHVQPQSGQARAKSVWCASTTDISLFPACRRRRVITPRTPPVLPRARAPTFAYHCLSCCWPVEPLQPPDQIAIASLIATPSLRLSRRNFPRLLPA